MNRHADANHQAMTVTTSRSSLLCNSLGFLCLGVGLGMGWAHTWTSYSAIWGVGLNIVGAGLLLASLLLRIRTIQRRTPRR